MTNGYLLIIHKHIQVDYQLVRSNITEYWQNFFVSA